MINTACSFHGTMNGERLIKFIWITIAIGEVTK